jgi:hypothetical protein
MFELYDIIVSIAPCFQLNFCSTFFLIVMYTAEEQRLRFLVLYFLILNMVSCVNFVS